MADADDMQQEHKCLTKQTFILNVLDWSNHSQ